MNIESIDWSQLISLIIMSGAAVLIYLKINLKIREPNEILTFPGRKKKLKSGETIGYRVIRDLHWAEDSHGRKSIEPVACNRIL